MVSLFWSFVWFGRALRFGGWDVDVLNVFLWSVLCNSLSHVFFVFLKLGIFCACLWGMCGCFMVRCLMVVVWLVVMLRAGALFFLALSCCVFFLTCVIEVGLYVCIVLCFVIFLGMLDAVFFGCQLWLCYVFLRCYFGFGVRCFIILCVSWCLVLWLCSLMFGVLVGVPL